MAALQIREPRFLCSWSFSARPGDEKPCVKLRLTKLAQRRRRLSFHF